MGTCDVGLDFSGANYIIHVELDWTPDNHTQMSGRILNPEKKEPTSSTYLVFGNTIEDDIIEMLLNKSKDIEQTIGGAMLTKIFNRIMEDPF
jgi:SNF2 family DNA or RNA helicase